MIPQTDTLKAKLQENRRRLYADQLDANLRSLGLSGATNLPDDFDRLDSAVREKEYTIYKGWASLRDKVEAFVDTLKEPIILAPLWFEELGTVRLSGRSLSTSFLDDPLKFDLDGFWIADPTKARLIDFDDDDLGADVWFWRTVEESQ